MATEIETVLPDKIWNHLSVVSMATEIETVLPDKIWNHLSVVNKDVEIYQSIICLLSITSLKSSVRNHHGH